MYKLQVSRAKEKHYNQNRFNIYLNGTLVSKIRHDTSIALASEERFVELQVRQGSYRSRKVKLDLAVENEILLSRHPFFFNQFIPMPLIILGFMPSLYLHGSLWHKWLAVIIFMCISTYAVWVVVLGHRKGILITRSAKRSTSLESEEE